MKTTLRLLALTALALGITACSTPKKTASYGDGKCMACTGSSHPAKKSGN